MPGWPAWKYRQTKDRQTNLTVPLQTLLSLCMYVQYVCKNTPLRVLVVLEWMNNEQIYGWIDKWMMTSRKTDVHEKGGGFVQLLGDLACCLSFCSLPYSSHLIMKPDNLTHLRDLEWLSRSWARPLQQNTWQSWRLNLWLLLLKNSLPNHCASQHLDCVTKRVASLWNVGIPIPSVIGRLLTFSVTSQCSVGERNGKPPSTPRLWVKKLTKGGWLLERVHTMQ